MISTATNTMLREMIASVGQIDSQEHVDLQRRETLDQDLLPDQRFVVEPVRQMLDAGAWHEVIRLIVAISRRPTSPRTSVFCNAQARR